MMTQAALKFFKIKIISAIFHSIHFVKLIKHQFMKGILNCFSRKNLVFFAGTPSTYKEKITFNIDTCLS